MELFMFQEINFHLKHSVNPKPKYIVRNFLFCFQHKTLHSVNSLKP